MAFLSTVGTAAMLWVGGNIVIHGLEVTHLGLAWAPHPRLRRCGRPCRAAGRGLVEWVVTAALDGVFGLALGLLLIPVATRVIGPLIGALTGKKEQAH